MDPVASVDLAFLAGCLAVLWTTTFANENEQRSAIAAALLLLLAWAWTKPLKAIGIDYIPFSFYSDLLLVAGVAAIWRLTRRRWLLALLLVIADRSAIHVAYNSAFWSGGRHNYRLLLNGLFALELAIAAWPGGRGAYEFLASSWRLHGRRRHRGHVPATRRYSTRPPVQK